MTERKKTMKTKELEQTFPRKGLQLSLKQEKLWLNSTRTGICLGRLSRFMGEVRPRDSHVDNMEGRPGEGFDKWCARVHATFGVRIPDTFRPQWDGDAGEPEPQLKKVVKTSKVKALPATSGRKMHLYFMKRADHNKKGRYDSLIVRSPSSTRARIVAFQYTGHDMWKDKTETTCGRLHLDQPEAVVITDTVS